MTRKTWAWLLLGLALFITIVMFSDKKIPYDAKLDPENPKFNGGQALARVLKANGIDLIIARSKAELSKAKLTGNTSVVITDFAQLNEGNYQDFLDQTSNVANRIYIGDGEILTQIAALQAGGTQVTETDDVSIRGNCSDKLFSDLTLFSTNAVSLEKSGCFDSVLVNTGATWLFTSPNSLTNFEIVQGDNAAIGLRLLGQTKTLVWYQPQAFDAPPDAQNSLTFYIPKWIKPGLYLLAITAGFIVLTGVRRLGKPVIEPLPVQVPNTESTLGRGELYRASRDYNHAAYLLRLGFMNRVTPALGLSKLSDLTQIAQALAANLGRSTDEITSLIGNHAIASEQQLVDLSQALQKIEDEVRIR